MRLTDAERAMLDGRDGAAKQKAMDLLMRYGEALGAERLVETQQCLRRHHRHHPVRAGASPSRAAAWTRYYSEFSLDSRRSCRSRSSDLHLPPATGIDRINPKEWASATRSFRSTERANGMWRARHNILNTCTPYQVGNVPTRGEHCAWMESSAVIYCNSVLGGRTNTEGRESTGAAMLTGRIPVLGLPPRRTARGTHVVDSDVEVESVQDWGLLGYCIGDMVQERVPVVLSRLGIARVPT